MAEELPPLPSTGCDARDAVLALPELNRGQILQLWGHSQAVALRSAAVPAALRAQFSFDMVIMLPRDVHNSMCNEEAGSQQAIMPSLPATISRPS